MAEVSVSSEGSSMPLLPHDSPGSSVSSSLQDEYDELLKFAVVMPTYNPTNLPQTLADLRGSFPYQQQNTSDEQVESDGETSTVVDEADAAADENLNLRIEPKQSTPRDEVPRMTTMPKQYPPLNLSSTDKKLADVLFDDKDSSKHNRSSLCTTDSEVIETSYTATIDPDIPRMEGLMDTWTYELKRNVLNEFSQLKIRLVERYRSDVQRQKERTAADNNRVAGEMEGLKELLHTYEQSIERKDQVISNLTRALQHQKDRFDMLRTFSEWKIRHNDQRREAFASNLARKHYERSLAQRAWIAWHGVVESKWKDRVEKACQAKAQEVCMQLTNDYEAKLNSLNEALEAARTEVSRLHEERDRYEETMKKAFMRGVCALNMEAMNMFHEAEKEEEPGMDGDCGQEQVMMDPFAPPGMPPATESLEAVYSMEPPGAPAPRVVTSHTASRGHNTLTQARTQSGVGMKPRVVNKSKTLSAKLTAREARGSSLPQGGSNMPMGLAPPMSSVMVERHQPITKQTIGHATAQQYPRNRSNNSNVPGQSGILHRKIAGQSGSVTLATPNVHTVKVVD